MIITDNVLVCVTQQKTCERLIRKGAILTNRLKSDLFVIHVVKEGVNFLGNKKEPDALEYLFDISKSHGADLRVLRSQDIASSIIDFAQDKSIGYIVLGEPPKSANEDGIISKLKEKLPFCEIHIVPASQLT